MWRQVGRLHAGTTWEQPESCPAPPLDKNDLLQLDLRMQVGPYLEWVLRSGKIPVEVRERQSGTIIHDFRGEYLSNDVYSFGLEGGKVSHKPNFLPQAPESIEDWLIQNLGTQTMTVLPLYLVHEICQPWTNAHGLSLRGVPAGEVELGAMKLADPLAEEHERLRRVTLIRAC